MQILVLKNVGKTQKRASLDPDDHEFTAVIMNQKIEKCQQNISFALL